MAKKKITGKEIVVRDGIYIPVKFLPHGINDSLDAYTKHMFDDKVCNQCSYNPDRPCAMCEECELEGYQGSICTASTKNTKYGKYLKVPTGDKSNVTEKLDVDLKEHKIVDIRCAQKLRYKWKFTGDLRDYQKDVQKSWMKFGYGLVKSAPRTGKTVMGIANAIKMGLRVVILADQKDFLDGFYETIENLTNGNELEELENKKIFGFLKKPEDYKNFDIGLLTYQSLISSNGRKRLKLLNKNFGVMIVDEVHAANATQFSRTISKLRMKHKFGLTATPKRKDGREFLVRQLIGPITARTTVKAMTPRVYCHKAPKINTRAKYTGKAGFSRFINMLAKNDARNRYILKCVLHDLKQGHSICLPCMRKEQVAWFVAAINEHYKKPVAAAFIGGAKEAKRRKEVVDDARSGKVRVVVGIRSLMQRGINVPKWSCLYYQMPMSNESNWEQESNRVCTPMEGKKDPIIRMFVDEGLGLSMGCWRSTVRFSKIAGHEFSDSACDLIEELGDSKMQRGYDEEDVYGAAEHGSKDIKYGRQRNSLLDGPVSL